MVLKQLVNAFLPLASCQLLPGLLAATYLHSAHGPDRLRGLQATGFPPPATASFSVSHLSFPLTLSLSLIIAIFYCPVNINTRKKKVFLSQISKYVPDERIG